MHAGDFVIDGVTHENTLLEDGRINQGDLLGDFEQHPLVFARWATLYELALDAEIRLKTIRSG